jgi:hypothetical protein
MLNMVAGYSRHTELNERGPHIYVKHAAGFDCFYYVIRDRQNLWKIKSNNKIKIIKFKCTNIKMFIILVSVVSMWSHRRIKF